MSMTGCDAALGEQRPDLGLERGGDAGLELDRCAA